MNGAAGTAGATCNEEQVDICRDAATEGRLDSLSSGGECISKPYLEFSHVCMVTDYLPTVDYCCCHFRRQMVLCCRYHQNWNHFRCSETDDVVEVSAAVNDGETGQTGLFHNPSLGVLLPSILVSVAILICIIIVCVRCYRRHSKDRRYSAASSNDQQHRYFNSKGLTSDNGADDICTENRLDDNGTTSTALTWSNLPTIERTSPASLVDLLYSTDQLSVQNHIEPSAPPAQPPDYVQSNPVDAATWMTQCIPTCCCCSGGGGLTCAHLTQIDYNNHHHQQQQQQRSMPNRHQCQHLHSVYRHHHHHCQSHDCSGQSLPQPNVYDHRHPNVSGCCCNSTTGVGPGHTHGRCTLSLDQHRQPPPPYSDVWDRM